MHALKLISSLALGFMLLGWPLAMQGQEPASSAPSIATPDYAQPTTTPPSAAATSQPSSDPATPLESLLIGPGDLLRIDVLREAELDQHVRVLDSGAITLALVGNLAVQGLTPAQAAARIAGKYRDGGFLLHPQVAHPGTVRLAAPRSLIDVLSQAGGLTESADRHIVIERGGKNGERIRAFLSNRSDDALNADVLVRPGDTVLVPKAGIVYILGDVAHPGGYVMQNDSQLTVLEAIALAAGTSKTASEKRVRLVRKIDGLSQSVDLPLRDMERGRAPDVPLLANDILYVPFSLAKNISLGIANITAAASSALIYAVH
jgi:polysaccharide export outer membrane protein